jgi:hypothetical protein
MNDETRNAIAVLKEMRDSMVNMQEKYAHIRHPKAQERYTVEINAIDTVIRSVEANDVEVERLRGEVAEQRKRIADDLLNLCLVCCEQPLRSFEEGNEASMGYPIMTGEECCGCPVPKVPKEVIEYLERLRKD